MMLSMSRAAWVAALLGATRVSAACSSNLLIDDFSSFSNQTNNLGSAVGDDGTMAIVTTTAPNGGSLTLVPSTLDSYLFESLDCLAAATQGYTAITFTLQGPANGSVALEMQTQNSCSAEAFESSYNVVTGIGSGRQQITLPLDSFDGNPNTNAIVGFVWSQFSSSGVSAWSLGNVQLVCGATAPPSIVTTAPPTVPAGPTSTSVPSVCKNLLIDDWVSQSRLTFLNYNAMQQASGDDGSMASIVVDSNRVMLTPRDTDSYFYSQFGCLDASTAYGGISLRIRAAAGTSFTVTLTSTSQCGGQATGQVTRTTAQLRWTFDGNERLYWFPFTAFQGINTSKLQMIYFSTFNKPAIFGPMSFYCGTDASDYVLPPAEVADVLPAKKNADILDIKEERSLNSTSDLSSTAAPFVLDGFGKTDTNALGQWHGPDDGLITTFGRNSMTISTNDSDLAWYTQLTETCVDFTKYQDSYLHVAYSGSNKFSIALQQHNQKCNENIQPYPETWDTIEAARYATNTDIYVPISHFKINLSRAIGFSFKGFYTSVPTTFTKIEIVDSLPSGFKVPKKLPSGTLVFSCTRPNSFAFAIDDGEPEYAQQVMEVVKSEGINVTFFTVGLPLLDPTTNLSNVYLDMQRRGHQIAMHSYTHPKMEGLPDDNAIDWEYNNDIGAVKQVFNGMHTPYFRPPFGTEGARMRQRLAATLGIDNPYIIQWSIDVEDWLWAETKTPEKQLAAFKRDLAKGGNLVVMHYLYPSTVSYLRQFIQLAKATGKQLMRVDQCMEDPNAPPL